MFVLAVVDAAHLAHCLDLGHLLLIGGIPDAVDIPQAVPSNSLNRVGTAPLWEPPLLCGIAAGPRSCTLRSSRTLSDLPATSFAATAWSSFWQARPQTRRTWLSVYGACSAHKRLGWWPEGASGSWPVWCLWCSATLPFSTCCSLSSSSKHWNIQNIFILTFYL